MCTYTIMAQEHFPKNDGVTSKNTNYTAFINAKIYVTPTEVINKGTLLIKEGKVIASGSSVKIPDNAIVVDLSDKSIYPSFIDIYSNFGVKTPERQRGNRRPQYDAGREGFYWNDHIMPEQNAIDKFNFDNKSASDLKKAGFGVVNTHMQDGVVRGTGALIALTNQGGNAERILDGRSAQYLSLSRSVTSAQVYPSSIMGTTALLRQMYYDADWYEKGNASAKDRSLEALIANKGLVQIIEAGNKLNDVRVDNVGDEFGIQYVIVGGGDEYERIADIKATGATYILPVNFPKAYDVENPFLANTLSVADMKEWNQKPINPKTLADNGIRFAFTTDNLKSPKELKTNILKAISYGLDKTKALEALTTIPANILGKSNMIGSLKNGAYANFLITSGDIFEKETTLYENWVKGDKMVIESMSVKDIRGKYNANINGTSYDIAISGSLSKPSVKISSGSSSLGAKITYKDEWVNIIVTDVDASNKTFTRLSSRVSDTNNLVGKATSSNGNVTSFTANKTGKSENKKKSSKKDTTTPDIVPVTYPNTAYGFETLPKQETLLFKNATVWTNETEGILENTDVLIKDGKISAIGKNLNGRGAKVIDATGKHITAGIIDEHSHIATSSVNESGHNSTAEVSIEEAVDPDDIDIYRNLAGGVTSIQILHGSANPIGGRSAIIKLKWGESAENLIYDNSPKFIKFALGENVKQSNWGDNETVRFPQSRMGVEQVFVDYFTRAREYEALKNSGKSYRKDAEMETLVEILNGERFISCHSYVQSEINMLMKVAEQFNFKVNTFTHILEGYKVADKMAKHGVGGSTFSDWWAYKFEVNDAIPYNASIMHNAGVTVAINSDDGEMSRRLNQEAAKTVKYGGVSEEDAWKFVTLNPAKLLHLDDRVGSLKVGKDADVVLWTDHPMSIYAKAEKTIIEGVTYFDLARDLELRAAMKAEKSKLTKLMLQDKNKGLKTQPVKNSKKQQLHCDSE
ncbi:amidohydrolase family protein [Winogradskyella sp. E313]|uniref:Amidohydrolase family protein n=2 Tax=Winogradskyella immobilis TaxID=2816852 RepID=A0ABS8EPK8_9FLAO|nr:amidohydrolase family protein [Winogradskyella immobilis]